MATEQRLETLLDDPFSLVRATSRRPSLQLPPLQDITPSRLSLRPLPLEPNTGANGQTHSATSKLSSHGSSSNEAQSSIKENQRQQKDGKQKVGEEVKGTSTGLEPGLLQHRIVETFPKDDALFDFVEASGDTTSPSRKRQKLEVSHSSSISFVKLPRPTEKEKKPAKVPTIAALNELKVQLSNAGHFPPITFLASDDEDNGQGGPSSINPSKLTQKGKTPSKVSAQQTRACKIRRKWTEQETQDLLKGVALYGVGHWKMILEDKRFKFDARSSVDLKDRFRTCCPNEYGIQMKLKAATARGETSDSKSSSSSKSSPLRALEGQPSGSSPPISKTSPPSSPGISTSTGVSVRSHRVKPEDLVRFGIDGPFPKSKRRERRAFTEEEDEDLLRGYMVYGPTWSRIREDQNLNLKARRAIDLRDRFRNRFPEKYAEAGFKMRPKDWPGPPPRSDKKGSQEGMGETPSSSPPPNVSEDALKFAEGQPEAQMEALVVPDEDLTIPSISSLLDWDDNTLPPFLTPVNGADTDMQNLLLDHIQPLLTYDPPRSSDSNHTSKNNSSSHNVAPKKTIINKDTTKKTTIDDLSKKPITPFHLPPPTDFLPLDFDISPLCTTTTASSSTMNAATTTSFSNTILSTLTPPLLSTSTSTAINFPLTFNLSLKPINETTSSSSSKRASLMVNPGFDPGVINPRSISTSSATSGGDAAGGFMAVAPAALIWEDMATHPMFDIDGGGG
ncbi:MAG: hypothetical protein M1816_008275 [Peltula sp. TS41687]|nr:MAG: hypothetical protein M1816_008275 [Peltula sp. TS41687]